MQLLTTPIPISANSQLHAEYDLPLAIVFHQRHKMTIITHNMSKCCLH